MMRQGSLFGDIEKASGQALVLSHTPDEYAEAFMEMIYDYARGHEFVVYDITDVVGLPPNHHNTVGALMSSAAKAGLIEQVGKRVKAKRTSRHSGMLEVWRRL